MADTTNTLRIWSHVRQIAPLSNNAAGDAWFSLNLAPVFVSDPAPATNVDEPLAIRYLLPWTWAWTSLRMALLQNGVVLTVIDVPAGQVLRESDPAPHLLTNEFNVEFGRTAHATPGAPFQSGCFVEAKNPTNQPVTMDEDTARDWKTYLLHASSYPGEIPLRAGLSGWFHVPYSALVNVDEIVVAPVFTGAPFSTAVTPPDPAAGCTNLTTAVAPCPLVRLKPTLTFTAAGDTMWVTRWTYAVPGAHDLQAEWIQPLTPLRTPGTPSWQWDSDGFIDEATLWVTPLKPDPAKPWVAGWSQSTDGHEQLEQRLSGLFDLPLRLLEWADQWILGGPVPPADPLHPSAPTAPPNPPPHTQIDPNFGTAFIATMRDLIRTVGDSSTGQMVERPDGQTVADDLARVIAPDDPTVRPHILSAVQAYEKLYDGYAQWVGRVTDVLTGSGRFGANDLAGGWENPPASGGDFNTWLKRIHKARAWLFDPDNLKAIIKQDWDKALAGTAFYQAWTDHGPDVDAYLKNTDVVTATRLGLLGAAWKNQTADWYAPANLAQNMSQALVNVYRERLDLLPQLTSRWGYQNLLPPANGATKPQQAEVEAYLQSFVATWAMSANGPTPDPTKASPADYSRGNLGLNIQFANYATAGASTLLPSNLTEEQFLAMFRGVGVMMRPSGAAPSGNPWNWCMLHLGQYSVRHEVDPKLQQPPAFDPDRVAVAPAGIVYRNGLRQVSCTYRNHPLASRSPAAALSHVRSFQGDSANPQPYLDQPTGLFELWNPYGRGTSSYNLPRLVFGTQYDTAAFAVGLAGELPLEISDIARPWRVSATPGTWNPPTTQILTTQPLLRTVPIGLVRVEGETRWTAGAGISKMRGPSMPDGVYPMVRSLKGIENRENTVILLCDSSWTGWNFGAATSNTFYIRPPATDLATFDSWPMANPAPLPADRAALYSFIAQKTDVQNTNDPKSGPDLTLDDPAVSGFSVMVTKVYSADPSAPSTAAGSPYTFTVQRPPRDAGDSLTLLHQYQSPSARVDIGVGPAKVGQSSTSSYGVMITIPAGSVYQVDITPVAVPNLAALALRPNTAPRTFYVEVATPLSVPDLNIVATALNKALVTAPVFPPDPTTMGDPLTVSLDLAALGALAPQIHRVELMIQRWRWQGRPLARQDAQNNTVYDFPYDLLSKPATQVDPTLEPLDGVYFGERDSNDQLIVSSHVDALLPARMDVSQLYSYDLTNAPQALYYRFAVRVFSRYEGLLSRGASVESRILGIAPPNTTVPAEQWRRVLPLCRRTQQAPKPAVRLIIPLTRAGVSETTPGLLVVLDEAWFDWAGLAEQLKVVVDSVTVPDGTLRPDGTTVPDGTSLTQAGSDPAVSNRNVNPYEVNPQLEVIGPVGFTFDMNTNAPQFAKTSFVIPAPKQASNGITTVTSLSWWFLQLKFQRAINPAGALAPGGSVLNNLASPAPSSLDSAWTQPIQVQLLPAANLWDATWTAAGTAFNAKIDTAGMLADFSSPGAFAVVDAAGNKLTVNPFPADGGGTNRFEVWVLLTAELEDAFGHGGQEAFVDLVPFSGLAGFQPSPGKTPTSLRLVEVQCMNQYSPAQTTWTGLAAQMFPPPSADKSNPPGTQPEAVDPAMARARIVRVSPPIMELQ